MPFRICINRRVNQVSALKAIATEILKEMFASNVGLLKRLLTEKWDEVL